VKSAALQFLRDRPVHGHRADRIAIAQAFPYRDDIGLEVVMLEAEPLPGPPHAGRNLIGHQQAALLPDLRHNVLDQPP
jgi:hypothetical protein